MALQGKFIVNNQPFSPLVINGVGTFQAYSGNDIYRNRGGCTAVPENGPIPAGRYWIVDRPTGGIRSQAEALVKDTANAFTGRRSHRDEWFALYRDDGMIDDWTWINGVKRGNFRLHPAGDEAYHSDASRSQVIRSSSGYAMHCCIRLPFRRAIRV
jgi:hypothetical protein